MARRLLAIWLPRLASEISLRDRPVAGPFALIQRQGNADHLHCLNDAASACGLRRGMTLADARAMLPELCTRPADLARETQALTSLRRWAHRYAPQVAGDGGDGLIADITGVAHLFGGETGICDDLLARLARAGLSAECAISGTRGAAHALARAGGGIIAEDQLAARLGPLPVSALRIPAPMAEGLARLGLHRISDLITLPRAPLARRFGPLLLQRLDQLLGHLPEPLTAAPETPPFAVRLTLPEPIGLSADVMAGLERLLQRLCARLAEAHQGARRLRLELFRVDKARITLEIGLARPMREAERIAALFRTRIDKVEAGYGIDALRLEVLVHEPLAPRQIGPQQMGNPQIGNQQIGHRQAHDEDALADLLSRLGNRLGFAHILRLQPAESHIPERSFPGVAATALPVAVAAGAQALLIPTAGAAAAASARRAPYTAPPDTAPPDTAASDTAPPTAALSACLPPRPALQFPPEQLLSASGHPPARFRWRGMSFTSLRAAGPERISPQWWSDDPAWHSGLRDYWRIETREGPRLWLFHTPMAPTWAVQGWFL